MYKIRKIKFFNHPILKNLELDFCDKEGKAVDTVIFAGENGVGKSTILNVLYQVATHTVDNPLFIEFENEDQIFSLTYYNKEKNSTWIYVKDKDGLDSIIGSTKVKEKYPFSGIFSDVDINFHPNDISHVTSMELDEEKGSRRSTKDIATQINQLLIDIQDLDDSDLSNEVRKIVNNGGTLQDIHCNQRMTRFTNAFNYMFEGLEYSRIENQSGKKNIIFQKYGNDISINGLSSGEKQIVYRGCFLLKDVNATNGTFVFIDEPEISLHPNWQKKILDYYKKIFTNEDGVQTSQIFTVTHSPFIIHNNNRRNDKVIVLKRDKERDINVLDRPEYYKCESIAVIEDAFTISDFADTQPVVYLEGRTDEKYFNRALEIFNYDVPFKFKWVGYTDENGKDMNGGKDALNKAVYFLQSRKLSYKNVCLYDCDAKKSNNEINNVIVRTIKTYENSKGIEKGIENALVLDNIKIEDFIECRKEPNGYGFENKIYELRKLPLCEYICSLDTNILSTVLKNLQEIIDELITLINT